jgi:HAE1 family hydrophobic/amphiphilic exporter-1
MFLSEISIKRPILMTMVILALIVFGGLAYRNMKMNLMPEVNPPYVTITTIYPGAGSKEVEIQLTKKIEDAVATVSGIKSLQSFSMESVSMCIVEFNMDKDPNVATQEMKDKIDLIINDLPANAEDPTVQKLDMQATPIMDFILSGDLDATELYEIADKKLKDRLSQVKGVGQVNLVGGKEREIHINLDGRMMYENLISLPQMMQILSAANMDMPGGYFQSSEMDYTVRLKGKFQGLEQIDEIEVPTAFGNKRMREFTDVVDAGDKVRERAVYYDNKTFERNDNVIRLSLVKSSDGNAVSIAQDVYSQMEDIKSFLPDGVTLEVIKDDSEFTQKALDDTIQNVLMGILFTSIVLLIFLHDIRSTLIVAISMPTAIVITFLIMQMFGLTKNVLSLMGLSVSVGVLVSNSVVVIENIFRHKNMGKDNFTASNQGTSEVTVAVIAATFTNIAVFVPIGMMDSMVGMMLGEAAIAAVAATAVSIFTAFTLTPMLASRLLPKGNPKVGPLSRLMNKIEEGYTNLYAFFLRGVLKNIWVSILVIIASVVMLVAVIGIYGPGLRMGFFPAEDSGMIAIGIELPVGYNLEATNDVAREIEERLQKHPDIEFSVTNLGKSSETNLGVNLGMMELFLTDAKDRDTTVFEYVEMLTEELSNLPNAKLGISVKSNMGDGGAPMQLDLSGPELSELERIKDDLMVKYKEIPGLINLDNSSRSGKPEVVVIPNRQKMAEAGVMVQDLAFTLRAAIEGLETSTQYEEKGEEYDMLITLRDDQVNSPEKVGNIPVVSPAGIFRLNQLCDIEYADGFTTILHKGKAKIIQFTAFNATGVSTGQVMGEINKINDSYEFPAGYQITWGGMAEMQNEMMADMMFAFIMAILLTYMLLAAILESFWQPLIILITVPLAMIGSVLAMYITNLEVGMSAMLGVIMLIGIVVNNAILILDLANQLVREGGLSAKEALIQAGPTKFKAILMSTIAIILGMLPMALGMGESMAEMRQPMGVISIGGLVASTVLTIFVVPAFYYIITSMSNGIKRIFTKKEPDPEPELISE